MRYLFWLRVEAFHAGSYLLIRLCQSWSSPYSALVQPKVILHLSSTSILAITSIASSLDINFRPTHSQSSASYSLVEMNTDASAFERRRPLARQMQREWEAIMAIVREDALSENETEYDVEEAEAYLDTCHSSEYETMGQACTPAYKAKRKARKSVLSPPPTPPNGFTASRPRTQLSATTTPQGIQKAAAPTSSVQKKRQARWIKSYRRMPTRSQTQGVRCDVHLSLADKKGKVVIPEISYPLSFNQVLYTTDHMEFYPYL